MHGGNEISGQVIYGKITDTDADTGDKSTDLKCVPKVHKFDHNNWRIDINKSEAVECSKGL